MNILDYDYHHEYHWLSLSISLIIIIIMNIIDHDHHYEYHWLWLSLWLQISLSLWISLIIIIIMDMIIIMNITCIYTNFSVCLQCNLACLQYHTAQLFKNIVFQSPAVQLIFLLIWYIHSLLSNLGNQVWPSGSFLGPSMSIPYQIKVIASHSIPFYLMV